MKVDAGLEIDSRSALSQPTRRCCQRFRQPRQAASIGKSAQEQSISVKLGWNSNEVNVHVHHVPSKARSREKLVDVSILTKVFLCPAA